MKKRRYIVITAAIALAIVMASFLILTNSDWTLARAGQISEDNFKFPDFDPEARLGTAENPYIILEIVPSLNPGHIGSLIEGEDTDKLQNKEIFKRNVLHIPDEQLEDFQIRVVTITPNLLNDNVKQFSKYYNLDNAGRNNKVISGSNVNDEIDLVGNADFISISPAMSGKNRELSQFGNNDINWQTTMELFMKVGVVEDSAPLLYDLSLITNPVGSSMKFKTPKNFQSNGNVDGYANNFYKLCMMLTQRDPAEVYNLFFNTNDGEVPAKVVTKTLNGISTGRIPSIEPSDAQVYWNEYTLLPAFPDGSYPNNSNKKGYEQFLIDSNILFGFGRGIKDIVVRNVYAFDNLITDFNNEKQIKEYTNGKPDNNTDFFDYLEQLAKEQKPNASRPKWAAPDEALEYIVNKGKSAINRKKELKILDLEPSNDFTLTIDMIRQMVPSYSGKITIEQQTTAEFIGKIEDLNSSYDMIFIGTKTGKMKTDSSGKTIYNDPLMDGLIYSHVGDRMIAFDTFSGILRDNRNRVAKAIDGINFDVSNRESKIFKAFRNWEFWVPFLIFGEESIRFSADFYRYSGNDITSIKKNDLLEYIDAGFPILLEKDLYDRNTDKLDDSSHLYDFISHKDEEKYRDQFINYANLTQSGKNGTVSKEYYASQKQLTELLANERLSINLITKPVEFDVNNKSTLIENRSLPFVFTILPTFNSETTDRYEWRIYVDANADGRFAGSEVVASGSREAGEEIRITKRLSEEYAGVIPWKLEVFSRSNPNIRTEKIGFSAFKVQMNALEKLRTQLNVLQITSNNNSTINLEELLNPRDGKTSLFYKYTHDLDDFNIKIKTVTVNEFTGWYKGWGNAYDVNNHDATDKLSSYDMLIFGFADAYSDISNENGALNNVQAFIDSGKSVMFTHDTTSFINLDRNEMNYWNKDITYWGYGINQYLRNRMGMDRFGVKKAAGDTTTYDSATMPSKAKASNIYGSHVNTYPEIQGLTYGTLVAYGNPVSKSKGISGLFQDIFGIIRHNANKDYPPFAYGNNYMFNWERQGNDKPLDQYMTKYVSKVNEGQITNYPYKIPDWFEVAPTHMQYYQLNMDDPEIVVWFALSDSKSNHNPANSAYRHQLNHTNETGPYSVSPNDVRNNYYIYSKGNVVYTGVGHTAIDKLVNEVPADSNLHYEVKLFINTIIASYNAGLTAPSITITNDDVVQNGDKDYLLFEDLDAANISGKTKRVYFVADEMNLLSEDLIIRIYTYNSSDELVLLNPTVKSDRIIVNEFNADGQEPGYIVKTGRECYFDFPLDEFSRNGSDKIYITVTNEKGLKDYANVSIQGRSLFDLD